MSLLVDWLHVTWALYLAPGGGGGLKGKILVFPASLAAAYRHVSWTGQSDAPAPVSASGSGNGEAGMRQSHSGVGSSHILFLGNSSVCRASSAGQCLVSSADVSGERRVIWCSVAGPVGSQEAGFMVWFWQPPLRWRSSPACCGFCDLRGVPS